MSTSKRDTSGVFGQAKARNGKTRRLDLTSDAVTIRKNGIEFLSKTPIPVWKEMSVDLLSSLDMHEVRCHGVVVSCVGARHTGYRVMMVFTNLDRLERAHLDLLAFTQV